MVMDADDFLEHFGIKGMKWGVRKQDEHTGPRQRSVSGKHQADLEPHEKAVVEKLASHGYDADRMAAMYGPHTTSTTNQKSGFRFTPGEKKALKVGAVAGVGALAFYGLNRYGVSLQEKSLGLDTAPTAVKTFWREQQKTSTERVKRGLSKDFVDHLSDERVSFKKGDIVRRVSTEKETTIRPGGFFAAHKDSDIEHYKAVLPIYWKAWGLSSDSGGYVVKLKANKEIKGPSPKETFDLVKKMMGDSIDTGSGSSKEAVVLRDLIVKLNPALHGKDDETLTRKMFPQIAGNWGVDKDPVTQHFFAKLKELGYNAVPDLNDAGNLADSPTRFIDGSAFEIAGTERLTQAKIRLAQEAILTVKHAMEAFMGSSNIELSEFLEHHGIKGMKWGVRKSRSAPKRSSEAKQKHVSLDLVKNRGGVDALTNHQLQQLNKRLELEKKFHDLDPLKKKQGQNHVDKMLKHGRTMNDVARFVHTPIGKMVAGAFTGVAAVGAERVLKSKFGNAAALATFDAAGKINFKGPLTK